MAKSEFLHVFGNGETRPGSALSNRTIRPVDSFASLASAYVGSQTDSLSICSTDHLDIDGIIHELLTNLRVTSPSAHHHHRKHSEHLNYLQTSLAETTHQCDQIIQHFRDRINEATRSVNDLQKNADRIDTMRDVVVVATKGKLILRSISPKSRHRDSEDSQKTAVSLAASRPQTSCSSYHSSIATQTALIDHFNSMPFSTSSSPTWLNRLISTPDSTTCKKDYLREVDWEFGSELPKKDHNDSTITSPSSKIAIKFKQLAKKKKKLEETICDLQIEAAVVPTKKMSGTSRLKVWLKRMVGPAHSARKLEMIFDVEERKKCTVGPEVKHLQAPPTTIFCGDAVEASIDNALRTSQVVLEAVKRDLQSIQRSLAAVRFLPFLSCRVNRH